MARIRTSSRGKTAAVAAFARYIDFLHFWRQLRAAGWTYKRPRGLATEGRYVSPDGVDIFVGENALVAHAVESGLLDEINDAADAAKTTAAAASTTGAGTQRCTERTRYC
jgi:hypothetical protein